MATIQRPTKEGSVRTYQEKVGLGFVDILASEMDADLDTIYAAWNGGADTINVKDGAITTAKIADAPNGISAAKLNDGAVTTAKHADAPNGVTTAKLNDGAVTLGKLASGAPVNNVNTTTGPISYTWSNASGTESGALVTCTVIARGGTVIINNHVAWYVASSTTAGGAIVIIRLKRDGTEIASRRYDVYMPASSMATLAGFSFADTGAASGTRAYSMTLTLFGPTG